MADVERRHGSGSCRAHLRDAHYAGAKTLRARRRATSTPTIEPHGVAAQQYLPDELTGAEYYRPTEHGAEAGAGRATGQDQRAARPRRVVGRELTSVVADQKYRALAAAPYRAVGTSTRADVATTEPDPVALAQFLPVEGRLGAFDADSLVRKHGKDSGAGHPGPGRRAGRRSNRSGRFRCRAAGPSCRRRSPRSRTSRQRSPVPRCSWASGNVSGSGIRCRGRSG